MIILSVYRDRILTLLSICLQKQTLSVLSVSSHSEMQGRLMVYVGAVEGHTVVHGPLCPLLPTRGTDKVRDQLSIYIQDCLSQGLSTRQIFTQILSHILLDEFFF